MIKNFSILAFVPALALAACGHHDDNANTTAVDNMTGLEVPDNSSMNGMAAAVPSGQDFANQVGASDQYEIEAGKLAQQKAQGKGLKDFGKMMVEHHTQSTTKLKAAGAKANPAIAPNPTLTAEQEANLAALRSADGAAFDTAYKTQQVAAHEKALALVQGYAASGDVAELKTFASNAQSIVQAHLTKIKGM